MGRGRRRRRDAQENKPSPPARKRRLERIRLMAQRIPETIHVGIDVGSTTTKAVALDPETGEAAYSRYARHGALQVESVRQVLRQLGERFSSSRLRVALCGSGGSFVAERLGVPFVQEVVAGALAVRSLHPRARCAIELGGQDAKMVFFRRDAQTGSLEVEDMRMNGSCAGGTGAFVDEIAALLGVAVEDLDALARRGKPLYAISGRCGVYAKVRHPAAPEPRRREGGPGAFGVPCHRQAADRRACAGRAHRGAGGVPRRSAHLQPHARAGVRRASGAGRGQGHRARAGGDRRGAGRRPLAFPACSPMRTPP